MAPSPTGGLHVGTARTALFNFLYARSVQGKFVMRIEDTDRERSEKKWEDNIVQGLDWLGIEWDEGVMPSGEEKGNYGPYRQSERSTIYIKYIEKMLSDGSAFYCRHTKDELYEESKQQKEQKEAPRHVCSQREESYGEGIIRFKNNATEPLVFDDVIKGSVSFDPRLSGDFSVAKSVDEPLYNLAVVIDDYEMKITDVIRGEDHISNTPKQMLLQKALGCDSVTYIHTPLLLGADRSKLSKRHGAVSVDEYRQQGYVPAALFNFLALLGWRPEGEREIFTKDELIDLFFLDDVHHSSAIFDIEKLNWMNGEYMRAMSHAEFAAVARQYVHVPQNEYSDEALEKILCLEQDRIKKLTEIEDAVSFAFALPDYDKNLLCYKGRSATETKTMLEYILSVVEKIDDGNWNGESLHITLSDIAEETGDKGSVFHPVRVAVSGSKSSPPPFDIMNALGKKESARRITIALNTLSE